jgi:Flp pilus assembly protein TadB
MSTPDRRPPRPRAGLAVQVGQTVLLIGLAALAVGFFVDGAGSAVGLGAVLSVVGLVLLVVGLLRRPRVLRD